MKTTTPSLKSFQPSLAAALAIVIVLGLSVRPAQAYTVTLQELGPNVVASGGGAIDLTGLTFNFIHSGTLAGIGPSSATIVTGPTLGFADVYFGIISGPTSFGSGQNTSANSGSGDAVGRVDGGPFDLIFLPTGYVSGNALSDVSTYNNATFASLGVTPGTYVWTWGTGVNQNFTLQIGPTVVPDAGSTVSLLGFALLGLTAVRRKLRCAKSGSA
jgi:VPDSG-CTERM motif